MTTDAILKSSILKLVAKLNHYDHLYRLGEPAISDAKFDEMYRTLQTMEADNPELIQPDSPTQNAGGVAPQPNRAVKHATPMLSLDNVTSEAEFLAWDKKLRKTISKLGQP